jgi:hypothetical protein
MSGIFKKAFRFPQSLEKKGELQKRMSNGFVTIKNRKSCFNQVNHKRKARKHVLKQQLKLCFCP